jgi:hypothetical protein
LSAKDVRYNRSEKGRARYERYRASEKGQTNEHRQHAKHNPKRIFVGSYYVGTESRFPYSREAIEAHLVSKLLAFKQKQAEEYEDFTGSLEAPDFSAPKTLPIEELLPLPPLAMSAPRGRSALAAPTGVLEHEQSGADAHEEPSLVRESEYVGHDAGGPTV